MTLRTLALLVTLSLLTFDLAAARRPEAITPERLLAPIRVGAAAGNQTTPHVAAGPTVSLAVWWDTRRGSSDTFAARIGSDGNTLDAFGIFVAGDATPQTVFWNGEDFSVVLTRDRSTWLARIREDAAVVSLRVIEGNAAFRFGDTTGEGANTRILLLSYSAASIFDAFGSLVAGGVQFNPGPAGGNPQQPLAGSRGDEFLILRPFYAKCGRSYCWIVRAERISTGGAPLSSAETTLQERIDADLAAVEGSDSGYVVVAGDDVTAAIIVFTVTAEGAWSGTREILQPAYANARYRSPAPQLQWRDDHYDVIWTTMTNDGWARVNYAALSPRGEVLRTAEVSKGLGLVSGVAFDTRSSGDATLIVAANVLGTSSGFDLYHHQLRAGDEANDVTQLLTRSATLQPAVQVAAFAGGFAAAWVERGPDAAEHVRLQLLDERGGRATEPMTVASIPCCTSWYTSPREVAVTATDDTLLVVWTAEHQRFYRRYHVAREWIDAEPQRADFVTVTGFANHFLALDTSIAAIVIPEAGEPHARRSLVAAGYHYTPYLATNDSGALLVWSEGFRTCHTLCFLDPFTIFAMRLAADGTPLDSQPIVIEDRKGYAELPSAAWDGERYVVVWNESSEARAATVSAEGVVSGLGEDGRGTRVAAAPGEVLHGRVFEAPEGVLLAISRKIEVALDRALVEGAYLARGTLLASLVDAPRYLFTNAGVPSPYAFGAATRGDLMYVAYSRVSEEGGKVFRVFDRFYAFARRMRSVAR